MPLDYLYANHLDAAGWEPQRQNNGLLRFNGLDAGGTPVPASAGSGGVSENALELALVSWPLPKETTNVTELDFLNEKRKFAGKTTYDDMPIVFIDYCEQEVAKLLQSWRWLVKNPVTGQAGLAHNYKKTGSMHLYAPDGTQERVYNLVGAWPSAFDAGDMDMAADDFVRITMTITVDKCIPADGVRPGAAK
jgi:hypothetical protein